MKQPPSVQPKANSSRASGAREGLSEKSSPEVHSLAPPPLVFKKDETNSIKKNSTIQKGPNSSPINNQSVNRKPTKEEIEDAIEFNNASKVKGEIGRFRLDWIRNLQKELGVRELSTDRSFNEETVVKIWEFQQKNGLKPDGKIGSTTRKYLQNQFRSIAYELLGEYAEEKYDGRELIKTDEKAELSENGSRYYQNAPDRFTYYKKMIEDLGGFFDETPLFVNIIAIRGAVISKSGAIRQTHTASLAKKDFNKKRSSGAAHFGESQTIRRRRKEKIHGYINDTKETSSPKKSSKSDKTWDQDWIDKSEKYKNYVNDHKDTWDDIVVSLYIDKNGKKIVRERKGSVDPGSTNDDANKKQKRQNKSAGTAHLIDGQHTFQVGRKHSTSTATHIKIAKKLVKESGKYTNKNNKEKDIISGPHRKDKHRNTYKSYAYTALRAHGNQEIFRESQENRYDNYHIDQEEFQTSVDDGITKGLRQYVDRSEINANFHSGQEHSSLSLGCQNIPPSEYENFMKEILEGRAAGQKTILYTLVDASKIPPKVEKKEIKGENNNSGGIASTIRQSAKAMGTAFSEEGLEESMKPINKSINSLASKKETDQPDPYKPAPEESADNSTNNIVPFITTLFFKDIDENKLTDKLFFAKHPERARRRIKPEEKEAIQEWVMIRDKHVRPALRKIKTERGESAPKWDRIRDNFINPAFQNISSQNNPTKQPVNNNSTTNSPQPTTSAIPIIKPSQSTSNPQTLNLGILNLKEGVGIKRTNNGQDVLAVQQRLMHLGFLSSANFKKEKIKDTTQQINHKNIPATIIAIKAFQREMAFISDPDGKIDLNGKTHTALNRANQPIANSYHRVASSITAVFEGGKPDTLNTYDNGIISYGRHQATLSGGNLYLVLEEFTKHSTSKGSAALKSYLPRVKKKDKSLKYDKKFIQLLKEVAYEPVMLSAQEKVFKTQYWDKSKKLAKGQGIQSALGFAFFYDTKIQGGLETDMKKARKNLGGKIGDTINGNKITEKQYLTTIIQARIDRNLKLGKRQLMEGNYLLEERDELQKILDSSPTDLTSLKQLCSKMEKRRLDSKKSYGKKSKKSKEIKGIKKIPDSKNLSRSLRRWIHKFKERGGRYQKNGNALITSATKTRGKFWKDIIDSGNINLTGDKFGIFKVKNIPLVGLKPGATLE